MLISDYLSSNICTNLHLFFDLTHFRDLGWKYFFLVQMKTLKFASEIYWPLMIENCLFWRKMSFERFLALFLLNRIRYERCEQDGATHVTARTVCILISSKSCYVIPVYFQPWFLALLIQCVSNRLVVVE